MIWNNNIIKNVNIPETLNMQHTQNLLQRVHLTSSTNSKTQRRCARVHSVQFSVSSSSVHSQWKLGHRPSKYWWRNDPGKCWTVKRMPLSVKTKFELMVKYNPVEERMRPFWRINWRSSIMGPKSTPSKSTEDTEPIEESSSSSSILLLLPLLSLLESGEFVANHARRCKNSSYWESGRDLQDMVASSSSSASLARSEWALLSSQELRSTMSLSSMSSATLSTSKYASRLFRVLRLTMGLGDRVIIESLFSTSLSLSLLLSSLSSSALSSAWLLPSLSERLWRPRIRHDDGR